MLDAANYKQKVLSALRKLSENPHLSESVEVNIHEVLQLIISSVESVDVAEDASLNQYFISIALIMRHLLGPFCILSENNEVEILPAFEKSNVAVKVVVLALLSPSLYDTIPKIAMELSEEKKSINNLKRFLMQVLGDIYSPDSLSQALNTNDFANGIITAFACLNDDKKAEIIKDLEVIIKRIAMLGGPCASEEKFAESLKIIFDAQIKPLEICTNQQVPILIGLIPNTCVVLNAQELARPTNNKKLEMKFENTRVVNTYPYKPEDRHTIPQQNKTIGMPKMPYGCLCVFARFESEKMVGVTCVQSVEGHVPDWRFYLQQFPRIAAETLKSSDKLNNLHPKRLGIITSSNTCIAQLFELIKILRDMWPGVTIECSRIADMGEELSFSFCVTNPAQRGVLPSKAPTDVGLIYSKINPGPDLIRPMANQTLGSPKPAKPAKAARMELAGVPPAPAHAAPPSLGGTALSAPVVAKDTSSLSAHLSELNKQDPLTGEGFGEFPPRTSRNDYGSGVFAVWNGSADPNVGAVASETYGDSIEPIRLPPPSPY